MKAFYIVHGFVQGVGYRAFVSGVAVGLGINGFVRNSDNGSVEIFAIGEENKLKLFEEKINTTIGKIEVLSIEKKKEFPKECMKKYNRFIIEETTTH